MLLTLMMELLPSTEDQTQELLPWVLRQPPLLGFTEEAFEIHVHQLLRCLNLLQTTINCGNPCTMKVPKSLSSLTRRAR